MSDKITLTLESPQKAEAIQPVEEENVAVKQAQFDESSLSAEEKAMVDDFAKQIDITSSSIILQYGANAQEKLASFSDNALENVRGKDLGEVGDALTNLIVELQGFEIEEKEEGIFGFFKKQGNKIKNLQTKYDKAENNVDKIVKILEQHQITLLKDIALLDELYEQNLNNYKELSMYILAGYKRLEDIKNHELPALIAKADASGLTQDTQAANDLANAINRFEKKLHDLELTRTVSLQMGPQIRLVQNNDTLMTEKIQSTLVNTIPLWKSQMVLALGVNHSKEAMKAQNEVSNMTNELLKKNAETLKMATIETAKESERGIVDIESLKYTNEQLITTLDEVLKIQTEGKQRRAQAQDELIKIEKELNDKLMEIRR
ncbi:MAG: toxic anion resistance protein [Erysipelotrichaceae bacterium]|nr:toxic anion resistance protein [Erysipelotrichaceae bacterium]MDY5251256.1 toxic anion resistance protein [Erysipelotrichaceae bacterium]